MRLLNLRKFNTFGQGTKNSKLKKWGKIILPSYKEMSFYVRAVLILVCVITFGNLVLYTSHQANAATAPSGTVTKSVLDGAADWATGYFFNPLLTYNCRRGSAVAQTTGTDYTLIPQDSRCASDSSAAVEPLNGAAQNNTFANLDFGITGALISMGGDMYSTPIASPKMDIQYYASKLTGETHAASNTSGYEVLTPMYFFSNTMKNLAYGVIVIILIVAALGILLATIGGSEQKITIVQLLMNTGLTLVLITLFYDIAGIIYDLTVNYGNALVASALEPFINAKVILERLEPGGDLNITALVNVFQFQGVNESLTLVAQNVVSGLTPAITSSIDVFSGETIPIIGELFKFVGGAFSYGLNGVISSLLSSKALFDAILAFSYFLISVRIFGNLLIAFVSYNIYVGLGPLLMLGGVAKGWDGIKDTFKTLFAYGLVFPTTFLFILLGATVMNFFIYGSASNNGANQNNQVSTAVLCAYGPNDPVGAESGVSGRWGVNDQNDDPLNFRRERTTYQRIYNTEPTVYNSDGTRDCRSKLFPVPWTFLPAPMGAYGNRTTQINTTDTLMRTVLAIAFLALAVRAPSLLKELLGVKELSSLTGLGKVIGAGLSPFTSFGAIGLTAIPMGLGLGKMLGRKIPATLAYRVTDIEREVSPGVKEKIPLMMKNPNYDPTVGPGPGNQPMINVLDRRGNQVYQKEANLRPFFQRLQNAGVNKLLRGEESKNMGDLLNDLGKGGQLFTNLQLSLAQGKMQKAGDHLYGAGTPESRNFANQSLTQFMGSNFSQITGAMNQFGNSVKSVSGLLDNLGKTISDLAGKIAGASAIFTAEALE